MASRSASWTRTRISSVLLFAVLGLVLVPGAHANVALNKIADDPFTNEGSQHATIVEPDTYSFGHTIVAVAQAGRFFGGGSSGIRVSTSRDDGATWSQATLPGITTFAGGQFNAGTDPSVAYDAKHDVWMVSTLGLIGGDGVAVLTSRSEDGGVTWQNPVLTAATNKHQSFDKNWIVCDNTASSPFYGSCYTQFDDFGNFNLLKMYYSRDGGLTWKASKTPRASIIGGQPLVMPNGNVVVPLDNGSETVLGSTMSTNGGQKFGPAFVITGIATAPDPGAIRSGPLPSAEIAGDGTIFVVWEDCRFRPTCPAASTSNDLVYTTSTNGTTWTPVKRIPIDPVTDPVDHFIPGIAVDRTSSAPNIKLGVGYYFFPDTGCTPSTCALSVGYVSSANGGSSWSTPTQLAGPMTMSWLPDTSQGRMVGDYMSSSFDSNHLAHPVFPVAHAPSSGADCAAETPNCDQALYTPATALPASGGNVVSDDAVQFTGSASPGASEFKHHPVAAD